MQTPHRRRVLATLAIATAILTTLAACSHADNPYAKVQNPPLVQAQLHTVTLVSDNAGLAQQLQNDGYTPLPFTSNYPASIPVEALLWDVPEQAAGKPAEFKAPGAGPNLRLLVMPLPPAAPAADSAVERDFFRNVLGGDVPLWPAGVQRAGNVRVQVWTYLVPNVLAAKKRMREALVPVVTDPVAITTSYLGDHKTMSIRAPDGAIVELVETAAQ
jgi:hypothetical protein